MVHPQGPPDDDAANGLRDSPDRVDEEHTTAGSDGESPTEVTPSGSRGEETPTRVGRTPEHPAPGASPPADTDERIGRYRVLRKLGEGGMGIVYLAEQREPVRRRVAVKVIKLGMDTREVVARFDAERQALAVMSHPSIAKVHDAGATESGRPYFVMELVQGIPINRYCDRNRLSTEHRIRLFIDVCRGVQHAHQKGVIHRDLKPSNILVVDDDGRPLPKIIDFGIAKATGQELSAGTLHTETGQLLGTPEYMSPEQVELSGLDIDTRTDIYSLGVILYELMTGELPFDTKALRSAGLVGMQHIIQEEDPPRPSRRLTTLGERTTEIAERRATEARQLVRQLRGDLDWIVMRALEKDRTRRYETANALVLELERYLSDEPVLARPPSAAYRLSKFVRRNKLGVAFGTALAAALVIGFVGTGVGFLRARVEATKATAVKEFLVNMLLQASPETARGEEPTVRQALDVASDTVGEDFVEQPEVEADVRDVIGRLYARLGRFDLAEPHTDRALDLHRRLYGERDEDTLGALNQKAVNLFQQQRYDEAQPLFERVVATSKSVLGEDHEKTLTAMHNLAAVYLLLERFKPAEPVLTRLLTARKRLLGEDHEQTTATMNNLAHLYQETGRYDEAEPLLVEALSGRRRALGEDHPRTLVSLFNLGQLHEVAERPRKAEPLYAEALAEFRRILGDDHPYTLVALAGRARVLAAVGRPAEAEPVAIEAHEAHAARYGESHEDTVDLVELIAEIEDALGRPGEAAAWRARAEAAAADPPPER